MQFFLNNLSNHNIKEMAGEQLLTYFTSCKLQLGEKVFYYKTTFGIG